MKANTAATLLLILLTGVAFAGPPSSQPAPPLSESARQSPEDFNVVWDSPSKDSSGSMPLGNGDLGLNVWVGRDGDLLFYLSKTDAVSENGQFMKLGRVRVKLTPNPFQGARSFRQELRLREGEIAITAGQGSEAVRLRVWADANRPVVHVEAAGEQPFELQASVETWRNQERVIDPQAPEMGALYELRGSPVPLVAHADTILPARQNQVVWFHRNSTSTYPLVLTNQHLAPLLDRFPDPLLHRTFGACLKGPGLMTADDRTVRSEKAKNRQEIAVYALAAQTETPEAWQKQLEQLVAAAETVPLQMAREAHVRWWAEFWDRSWIRVSGSKDAEAVSRGYALQRWLVACGGRGNLPLKFNGAIFTVDAQTRDPRTKAPCPLNADYRAWGGNYWFQNTRLIYWPLLMSGDYDLLEPWFKMYRDCLPLAKERTRLYYHHNGAFFNETMYFWGTANNANFGWGNPGTETVNGFIRRYWQGGLELVAVMLDRYDLTEDAGFARQSLVPLAEAITTFFDEHWPRDNRGKVHLEPAQSLETWHVAVNPLPDIAGLRWVLPRLLSLPKELTSEPQRARWQKLLADLPPVPLGKSAAGKTILLPAEKFSSKHNAENTELYAVWPYRLYGVATPEQQVGLQTYELRQFRGKTCWSQEGMHAACLGLAEDAKAAVVADFTALDSRQRFGWFWRAGHDWTPDMDNGGAGMIGLQLMLMQTEGRRIQLLPAWPREWNADFRLHAPFQTTVEGKIRDGKLRQLKVTPEARRKDIVTDWYETGP